MEICNHCKTEVYYYNLKKERMYRIGDKYYCIHCIKSITYKFEEIMKREETVKNQQV